MRNPLRHAPRRRRETRHPAAVLLSAALVFALIAVFLVVTLRAPRGVPFIPHSIVTASLPDVGNLRTHSEVRANGVRLGEVTSIRADNGRALVRLKLGAGVGDLPEDTTASVHGKGVLGARFIDLEPGNSPRPLADGGTIYEAGNPITLSVSDALDVLDARTRGGLRSTVDNAGRGLLGRGRQLNDALRRAPVAFDDLGGLVDAIHARPGAAARLLPALDDAMVPLNAARDDIAGGLQPTARALHPFVDRRTALRETLEEAPGALAATDSGLSEGRRLLGAARSLATAATATLPRAPRGLRAATQLMREAPGPLERTRLLLGDLGPSVPAVLRVTDRLAPVLGPLRDGLQSLTPMVATLGAHGCDIVDFGDNMRSVLNQGIAGGGAIGPITSLRFTVFPSADSLSNFGPGAQSSNPEKFHAPCQYSVPQPVYGSGR